MPIFVRCPACRASLLIQNAKYLVVLNCHVCGCEFLADGNEWPLEGKTPPVAEELDFAPAGEEWPSHAEDRAVLMFCPMCGELAAESDPACPACGESLPDERGRRETLGEPSDKVARRFRRQARLLGLLWIVLAYLLADRDFWVGGTRLALPQVISGAGTEIAVPALPLLASLLIGLGLFALLGQFWAVAVGGLFNYLVLFLMVWQANPQHLALIVAVIVLTHITLHQAASARFR